MAPSSRSSVSPYSRPSSSTSLTRATRDTRSAKRSRSSPSRFLAKFRPVGHATPFERPCVGLRKTPGPLHSRISPKFHHPLFLVVTPAGCRHMLTPLLSTPQHPYCTIALLHIFVRPTNTKTPHQMMRSFCLYVFCYGCGSLALNPASAGRGRLNHSRLCRSSEPAR